MSHLSFHLRLFILLLFASTAFSLTPLSGCADLDVPYETYYLTNDISMVGQPPGSVCFNIVASNVVLDGRGFSITGDLSQDHVAVWVGNASVAVGNLSLLGAGLGVASGLSDVVVENVSFFHVPENKTALFTGTTYNFRASLLAFTNMSYNSTALLIGGYAENVTLCNIKAEGVYDLLDVGASTYSSVRNITICSLRAALVNGTAVALPTPYGLYFYNNEIWGAYRGYRGTFGSEYVLFENNTFSQIAEDAVYLYRYSGSGEVENLTCSDVGGACFTLRGPSGEWNISNVTALNVGAGIGVGSADLVSIRGVHVENTPIGATLTYYGSLYLFDSTFINATSVANTYSASTYTLLENNTFILTAVSFPNAEPKRIFNNTFANASLSVGAVADSSQPLRVLENAFFNSSMSVSCAPETYVAQIRGNTFADKYSDPIPLGVVGCSGSSSSPIEIRDNTFRNISFSVRDLRLSVIRIYNSYYVDVFNNTFENLTALSRQANAPLGLYARYSSTTDLQVTAGNVRMFNNTAFDVDTCFSAISEYGGLSENYSIFNNTFYCKTLSLTLNKYSRGPTSWSIYNNTVVLLPSSAKSGVVGGVDLYVSDLTLNSTTSALPLIIRGEYATVENIEVTNAPCSWPSFVPGLSVLYSSNVTLSNISSTGEACIPIYVDSSQDVVVENATLNYSRIGVQVVSSAGVEVANVSTAPQSGEGIRIMSSSSIVGRDLVLLSNTSAVVLSSSNISLSNLSARPLSAGILSVLSQDVNVWNASVQGGSVGVGINDSQRISLSNAEVGNATSYGFFLYNASVSLANVSFGDSPVGISSPNPSALSAFNLSAINLHDGMVGFFLNTAVEGLLLENASTALNVSGENISLTSLRIEDALQGIDGANLFNFTVVGTISSAFSAYLHNATYFFLSLNASGSPTLYVLEGREGVIVDSHLLQGATVENSTNVTLAGSLLEDALIVDPTSNSLIENNTILSATTALIIDGDNNTVRNNTILSRTLAVNITSGTNNSVYNNYLLSPNPQVDVLTADNYLNTSLTVLTAALNVINGSILAGNYYASPAGDGYSQTCWDENSDFICDEPVAFGLATDYLPLSSKVVQTFPENNSKEDQYVALTYTTDGDILNCTVDLYREAALYNSTTTNETVWEQTLPDGNYTWNITCYLTTPFGIEEWKTNNPYTFEVIDPNLTLTADPAWTVTAGTETNVSCHSSNPYYEIALYRDGVEVARGYTLIWENSTLPAGQYEYECAVLNTTYSNATASNTLYVVLPDDGGGLKRLHVEAYILCPNNTLVVNVTYKGRPVNNAKALLKWNNYVTALSYTEDGIAHLPFSREDYYLLKVSKRGFYTYEAKLFLTLCREEESQNETVYENETNVSEEHPPQPPSQEKEERAIRVEVEEVRYTKPPTLPYVPPYEGKKEDCCLFSICSIFGFSSFLGICWYVWLLIAVIALLTIYELEEHYGRKKRSRHLHAKGTIPTKGKWHLFGK